MPYVVCALTAGGGNMLRKPIPAFCFAFLCGCLIGCSMYATDDIASYLVPSDLYRRFSTKSVNLASKSQCSSHPSIKLVNAETRTVKYLVWDERATEISIIPKTLVRDIIAYLKDGFEKSNIKVDSSSSKTIYVFLDYARMLNRIGSWAWGGVVRIKISIPELRRSKIYKGKGWTIGSIYRGTAYAIHEIVTQIINDPDIQNYILCRTPTKR